MPSVLAVILACGLGLAQEPSAVAIEQPVLPPQVAVTRLPVLAAQLREREVSEAELRALLETALGSGVALSDLVEALEVVVEQLDQGTDMPDLALRLPGLIGQGFQGDSLAATLQAAGPAAAAALPVAWGAAPEPVEPAPEPASD